MTRNEALARLERLTAAVTALPSDARVVDAGLTCAGYASTHAIETPGLHLQTDCGLDLGPVIAEPDHEYDQQYAVIEGVGFLHLVPKADR